ncbi:MAG TPA: DUF3016 domain-containing protein [Telluria sp.]
MKPVTRMRALRHLALAGLFLLSAGSAAAAATVNYVEPEHYGEMPFPSWERDDVFKELSAHFDRLARQLPPGQDLKVDVLDLRLAGHMRRGARDIRIITGRADWPHMELRYAIESGGQVVTSGQSKLSDMTYMDRSNRYADSEPLRYEKRMLDDWFKKTLAPR